MKSFIILNEVYRLGISVMLSKGMKNQLIKQLGEYLVAAELSRRGVVCTTFTGNMPRFDLLAMNSEGESRLIQVKARKKGKRSGIYYLDAAHYLEISKADGMQTLRGKKRIESGDIIWVFAYIGEGYGDDVFYILSEADLQNVIYELYGALLVNCDGRRRKNWESTTLALYAPALADFKDKWDLLAS